MIWHGYSCLAGVKFLVSTERAVVSYGKTGIFQEALDARRANE